MATTTKTQREESLAFLRGLCPEGATIYTILRHVSRSGMQRVISCYVISDGEPRWVPSPRIRDVIGCADDRTREGNKISGCGMDMGFHLVSSLSRALYPDVERPDYALSHRWL